MAIVETPGGLDVGSAWQGWPGSRSSLGLTLYNGRTMDYAALYRAQPNVRLVVRFVSRNIAQLGLNAFRRVSATQREPLDHDHELAQVLRDPFPTAPKPPSRHRFVRTMVEDLAIFDRYYAWARRPRGRLELIRLPPQQVEVTGNSILGPTGYKVHHGAGEPWELDPADVIHLYGHDPANATDGISPLEALRRILAEDLAAGDYRHQFWLNAARISGIITRPVEAPKWGDPARNRFEESWRAAWTGSGSEPGGTPILEEGMTFHESGFNAQESEYLAGRKLTREEVSAAYYIPPVFVGLNEGLTFAQVKESRSILYTDTLGPWLEWITTEIESQVVPLVADNDRTYVDFNVEAKLAGSFHEQAQVLSTSVGAPWLLRDEARAKANLPPLPDGQGEELVTPLNVLVGGLASPRDTSPPPPSTVARPGAAAKHRHQVKDLRPELQGWEAQHEEVLRRFFTRQRDAVLGRLNTGSELETAFDFTRWNDELAADLLAVGYAMAEDLGGAVAEDFDGTYDADLAIPWLTENARIAAEAINTSTYEQLQAARGVPRAAARRPGMKLLDELLDELDGVDLWDDDTPEDPTDPWGALVAVFATALAVRVVDLAITRVTSVGQWARRDAAETNGARTKTWVVNADPSRHADLDGETVPMSENFSNGAAWPGDPILGPDDNAGCLCSLDFG